VPLNQPVKSQSQTFPLKVKRRCAFRSSNISWCKKQQKICDAPSEYNFCTSYQPKPDRNLLRASSPQPIIAKEEAAYSPHTLLVGVKTGPCDICKVTKKTLLLRFGFSLCEDCLNVCTSILEKLQFDETNESKEQASIGKKIANNKTKIQKAPHNENTF
jgi:hypothetical protein